MIDVTAGQIQAAQAHDMAAIGHINSEMESRICQLARKVAGSSNRELVEDLEQDGRLALFEALGTFQGSSVAAFFSYVSRCIAGAMTNSRKTMHRGGVSRETARVFELAVDLADGDVSEAERVAQSAEYMGRRLLSPELAYAARLSYVGEAGTEVYAEEQFIESPDMPTYEINYDAIADAADEESAGGRPFTWQTAGRTIERSVKTPTDPTDRTQVMDSLAAVSSGAYGSADLETLERATTSYRSTGLDDAFAILASRAQYNEPDAEGATPSEINKRLSGERIGRVRAAVKEMPADLRSVVQTVFGVGGGIAVGTDPKAVAAELSISLDVAPSVMIGAQDWVRRALNGEKIDEGKACSVCHVYQPLENFYVSNKKTGTRRGSCKRCKVTASVKVNANPVKKRAENARYRAKKAVQYGR